MQMKKSYLPVKNSQMSIQSIESDNERSGGYGRCCCCCCPNYPESLLLGGNDLKVESALPRPRVIARDSSV